MAQNLNVNIPVRTYTRSDFTALRAKLNKIPTARIMDLYFCEDDLLDRQCDTPPDLDRWLDEMRDHLSARASIVNPHIAELLGDARKLNTWSKGVIEYLIEAGEQDTAQPRRDDALTVWFKPRVAQALHHENIKTIGDLKTYMEKRGSSWWLPIPRVGRAKALVLEKWLTNHASSIGGLVIRPDEPVTDLVEIEPGRRTLVPLERITVPRTDLDGSQGINRNPSFCLISAKNDLGAIRAYLHRFRDREKTYRSYKKELERFLLWCIYERHRPMSGVLTDECEAYKDFLADPATEWIGPKTNRLSPLWKPFAGPLRPSSQRYAVQVIRTFFEWLVAVRYLGGNPWITVSDPVVEVKEEPIDIDKALPKALWDAMSIEGGILDKACAVPGLPADRAQQYRIARAAILLIGYTGLRREEAANATRNRLKPVTQSAGVKLWELAILGKRSKWRTVYLPERVIDALRAHWIDRGHDFEYAMHEIALLSPITIPQTRTAMKKHVDGDGNLTGNGFSPDGIYQLVTSTLKNLADDDQVELEPIERDLLRRVAPHALRHTFATLAAAKMPLDVLQKLMGHASLNTTSIYDNPEKKRSIAEVAKYWAGDG